MISQRQEVPRTEDVPRIEQQIPRIDHAMRSYVGDLERSLLAATVNESNLTEALETRTTIGQAVGLFMAQEAVTAEQAFQKFVIVSQKTNVKLRLIAQQYVQAWEDSVRKGAGK